SLAYTDLSNNTIIPLGVNATEDQQITISIADSILPEETEVYLEDKLSNTFTLLNTNNYTFLTNSNLSGTGRFFLHITNATLTFGQNVSNSPQIFTSNGSHTLHIKGTIEPNTVLSVFNLQGRMLLSTQLDEHSTNNHVDISSLSKGMYLVKLKNSSMDKIKKILIR
ncbi:T9SS type A sorting domain-containing protein, partial [Gelidibacter sp.]|uniref:T9SS type A sorting domain-containing protein n=1 Tax=Gelidibacter sp. TaxID=2018083 RepID=UPI003263A333